MKMTTNRKKMLSNILLTILFVLFVFILSMERFDNWFTSRWESPNYAVEIYPNEKAKNIAKDCLRKDLGIELNASDRIPFMAYGYLYKEFLFLIEPHNGFDYDEFIEILLSKRYSPKGYIVEISVEKDARQLAISYAKHRRESHPNFYWWRPDKMIGDIIFVEYRIRKNISPNDMQITSIPMYFLISKEDHKIYVRRSAFSYGYDDNHG